MEEPRLEIECDAQPKLHAVFEQNDVPAIPRLVVRNRGIEAIHDLRLHVELPGLSKPFEVVLDRIGPGSERRFEPVPLRLDGRSLREVTEREKLAFVARIDTGSAESGTRTLLQHEESVEVFPLVEWPGLSVLPELTAAFVLPNARAIDLLLAKTAARLTELTGRGSLDGTTSRDKERMRAIVRSVFETVAAQGITYALPPASFEDQGQKVRLPDDVLEARLGTCLDTSFLIASMLEQAGLHPLVVFTEGHAFVACWLSDQTFAECTVRDGQRFRKRVDLDDLVVVETTLVTESGAGFDLSTKRGRAHLDDLDKFHCAIDVRQARRLKIRPLPIRQSVGSELGEVQSADPAVIAAADPIAEPEPAAGEAAEPTPDSVESESREAIDASAGGRIGSWKRRLLDLSLRNRLLNFRPGKRTVQLFAPDLGALEDAVSGRNWFTCRALPPEVVDETRDADRIEAESGEDPKVAYLRDELSSNRLHADLPANDLDHRLLEIYRSARLSLEESGAGSLYLAIGMLEWFEADSSSEPRRAPLLLLPLEIERLSAREGFRVRLADDEPQVNVTLLEKLDVEFGVDTTGLDELPADEDGLDVQAILDRVRRAVLPLPRAEVVDEAWVALFSFKKFLMWRDLQARSGDLLQNEVLRHLVERPGASFDPDAEFPEIETLDATCSPLDMPCPLNADSSQLRAVVAATTGRSFVLEGPPGTGKSQTITNLISTCLARGQRVLFVAEKRAALEVVRDRLGRVGLDAFCLELHSNKARKREVLESLAEPLELSRQQTPRQWQQTVRDLCAERDALNEFVQTLHRERAFGESLFDLTARLVALRDVKRLRFDAPSEDSGGLPSVDHAFLEERRTALSRALAALREVGPPALHPLRGLGGVRWSATVVDRGEDALRELSQALDRLDRAVEVVASRLSVPGDTALSGQSLQALVAVTASLRGLSRGTTRALFVEPDWSRVRERALAVLEEARARTSLESHVEARFTARIREAALGPLKVQVEKAASTFWPLSWLRGRSARSELRAFARESLPPNAELVRWLESAQELVDREAKLDAPGHEGSLWFDERTFKAGRIQEAEIERLREAVEQVGRFRADLDVLRRSLSSEAGSEIRESMIGLALRLGEDELDPTVQGELERLDEALEGFRAERSRTCAAFSIEGDPFAEDQLESERESNQPVSYLELVRRRLDRWRAHLRDRLREWTFWVEARSDLTSLGCDNLVEALERDPAAQDGDEALAASVGHDEAVDVFERSWREAMWNHIHDHEEVVRRFHGPDHERRIERFRELDERVLQLSQEVARAKLCAKVPDFGREVSDASEVGLLKRELRKKRRHLPVRKLLDQTQHLTPRLKPCFLMSPLSVAQYLDAGDSPFDLVVFDEASQIAPWDAVGAIARGSHCVVVGDSRQLPPTSFFQTMDGEEFGDDEDIEDLESILDEFSAAGFRALDLEWHYRSRHESLIAFSNHHYYENRLLTFPSPAEDVDGMGLSVKPVPDGVYDRSKSRTNRKEAESVVEDLCSRLRAGTDNSLGVVTFSMAQRELIEDLLDVERRKSPELERFFSVDVEEPVFVKNLENVQGDERDVILFSIGYGPDASGKVSMHFGPLNLSGGERRLNVAVTRARRQIVVHSTLRADQIDLRRTQAEGVKGLKNFLEYAERGSAALSAWAEEVGPGEAESPFEAEVAAALRARGHDVAYQVGCSGYRIDLAIRDPEAPGRFVLGIECDGANYHSAKTARDRDRIRESVLRGLGWEICRIWSTDWWRHPAREIERVEAALERAKAIFRDARAREAIEAKAVSEPERFASSVTADHAGDEGEGAPEEAASEVVTEDQASIGVDEVREVSPSPGRRLTYQSTPSSQLGTNEQFFTPASDGALREFAGRVLELEAPIVERLLQRRLVDAFEQRLTKKARDRVADVLAALPEAVRPRMHEGAYWRPDQDPLQFAIYRVPDESSEDPREADEIPVIETVNAALDLVQASIALPKDELVREMARQFGFARLGSRVEVAMTSGVDTALAKGALILKSDGSVVVAG